MALSFTSRAVPAPDVIIRIVGDEAVLLKNQLYMGLDAVGTHMWTVVTGAGSIQQAYDSLLAEYNVDVEQLCRDLQEFLGELELNGLIEIRPGGEPVP